ncbi:MAG: restriction endonuclease subunit S [Verrucomicrobia bacterium]|nr:restriction endonuclease subunit S [Verrucomicrobiota bacterium]
MNAAVARETRRLKYAATVNDEALADGVDPDFTLQYVDIGDVDSEGRINGMTPYRFEKAPSRARRIVKNGDVIVSTVRTYLQAIAPIQNPPDNLIVSTGFAVVRPRPEVMDTSFCKYALRDPAFLAEVEMRSVGVSYPAINASELGDIRIHLCPVPEQRAIGFYLDNELARLDELVTAKERWLEFLAEKRQALITHAVTRGINPKAPLRDSGIPWLGEIPAHWNVKRLRWFILALEQGWSPQAEDRQPDKGEWAVLKLNAVDGGRFDGSKAKALPPGVEAPMEYEVRSGDFLVTRANTPKLVGDVCFVEHASPRLILSDLIYRLKLVSRHMDGRFLNHFLLTAAGRSQIEADARGSSASMVKIAQDHIKNWLIIAPPLGEQQAIVAHIAKETATLDALRAATENSIALLKERRGALISAAVTGKLRIQA